MRKFIITGVRFTCQQRPTKTEDSSRGFVTDNHADDADVSSGRFLSGMTFKQTRKIEQDSMWEDVLEDSMAIDCGLGI